MPAVAAAAHDQALVQTLHDVVEAAVAGLDSLCSIAQDVVEAQAQLTSALSGQAWVQWNALYYSWVSRL